MRAGEDLLNDVDSALFEHGFCDDSEYHRSVFVSDDLGEFLLVESEHTAECLDDHRSRYHLVSLVSEFLSEKREGLFGSSFRISALSFFERNEVLFVCHRFFSVRSVIRLIIWIVLFLAWE